MKIKELSRIILIAGILSLAMGWPGQSLGVDPSMAQAPQTPTVTWTFGGRVYDGDVGDEGHPLESVTVAVYGANNPYPDYGTYIRSSTTDGTGWYGLDVYDDDGLYEFYHIVETTPAGYISVGATTISGTVHTANWIEYVIPLEGKTLIGNKFWDQPEGAMPDLIVTDVWNEDTTICYQIMNVGEAMAPEGHVAALFVDGEHVDGQPVTVNLEPGERWEGCFAHVWACTPPEDAIMVWADWEYHVAESDEENNAREEFWPCDTVLPEIIFGPIVVDVTQDSAVIFWETNEDTDSMVRYGRTAREYAFEEMDPTLVPTHTVTLMGLLPATTYRFMVQSADASGNTAQSRDLFFETLPADDSTDPSVTLYAPTVFTETVVISADASDDTDVEKVEFYVDGDLVFTDYSPPYVFDLDTTPYANGNYTVTARAHDLSGRVVDDGQVVGVANVTDVTAPAVTITAPTAGATVSGQVNVTAVLTDDMGLAYVYFRVNGAFEAFEPLPSHPKNTTLTFEWDTTTVTDTTPRLAVEVYDTDFKYAYAIRDVTVSQPAPPAPPKLKVTHHKVTRYQNGIVVELTVQNVGSGTATDVVIQDFLRAFQSTSRSTTVPNLADYEAHFTASTRWSDCTITDYVDIAPGQSRTYSYSAVPILLYPNTFTPSVGETINLSYADQGDTEYSETVQFPVSHTTGNEPLPTAHANAAKQADYLIVTNPQRLFWYHVKDSDVDALLAEMAQLAVYQQGALGYIYTHSKSVLDILIEPFNIFTYPAVGDNWAMRLHPNFSQSEKGYLLIVGETEIVPAWEASGFSIGWGPVKYSDHGYADTGGTPAPDLVVGRIVGDKATTMIKPIQASNGVYAGASGYDFDRDNATLISGPGFGTFVQDIEDVGKILQSDFTVKKMHGKNYFPVSSFARDYQQSDSFAVGDVRGDATAEIIVADASADKIYVYDSGGTLLDEFHCGFGGNQFEDGDKIAVGNFNIVMADHSANRLLVYNSYGISQTIIPLDFEPSDDLALGNVTGDGYSEIVIADSSANKIYFYTLAGAKLTEEITQVYDQYDNMAVGDVWGSAYDEVVITDRSANKLLIYSANGTLQGSKQYNTVTLAGVKTLNWLEYIDYDVAQGKDVGGSALAVGNLYPWPSGNDSGKEEILLAAARGYQHIHIYWWNADKNALYDTAAIPFNFDEFDGLATGDIGNILGRTQDEVFVADRSGYIRTFDTNNWLDRFHTALPEYTQNADVIYLSGHGNVHGCCGLDSADSTVFPLDFNDHNPFVMATSCSTGNYQDGGDTNNFAESLLNSGAAIYVGSTQSSHGGEDTVAATTLFKNWQASESVGEAFTGLERSFWKGSQSDNWWFWVWEYNLYGDPKFGATSPTVNATTAPALAAAPTATSSLQIEVPDYVVTTTDGLDQVQIPGGRLWLEEGDLWIPFYTTAVDYPQGHEVQDVILIERSGLMTDTGLHLPMTPLTHTGCACTPEPYGGSVEGWFPEAMYDWGVIENPDGTSTLVVTMYPFYYNTLTTDVEFYKHYAFEINYTVSTVTATVATDKAEYGPGDIVTVHVGLDATGDPQDVVVSALVMRYGTTEVVDGLLLETLSGQSGPAAFSPQWDSSAAEPGLYYVEVTLRDAGGDVLDRQTETFALGVSAGAITGFTVAPEQFEAGDGISVTLVFSNTGTVEITGSAVVQVLDQADETVQEFHHDVTDLSPGNDVSFDDVWDTSGVTGTTYTLVGYVQYGSTATDPVTATVSTVGAASQIYLPVVLRGK
jgi:hypothetical protein